MLIIYIDKFVEHFLAIDKNNCGEMCYIIIKVVNSNHGENYSFLSKR